MDCKEGNAQMFRQIDGLLSKLDEMTYSQPLELFNGSTVGQHVRHILNFYQSVLLGVRTGTVDYAKRERDPRVEELPDFARMSLDRVARAINELDEARVVLVRADFAVDEKAARPLVSSSAGRELMFAFDHAVHHLAIIKMGLRSVRPELVLEQELGVAPSTLKYQKGSHLDA